MTKTDSPIHIVMADDDAEDLELLQTAIHSIEPEVQLHLFNNGITALEYLMGSDTIPMPSLIIFDYNMPQKNGAQLLLSLNEDARYSSTPKIILSTSNAPLHIEECLNNGATDYLIKPFHLQECYELARKLLRLCRA
ncbi:response regulator [Pseudoflavitalea rhizosphaerae]|uniref:response regulator n=1 Tax=Pseudoflavitalea rhizosphaerae TaxID=1884793 RepID=UPI000F8DE8A7|nr:response regulator [Pseudoflavitalea rhizosphaerae]